METVGYPDPSGTLIKEDLGQEGIYFQYRGLRTRRLSPIELCDGAVIEITCQGTPHSKLARTDHQ